MTTSRRRWRWSLRKRRARRGNCSRTKMSRPAGAGAGAWPLPAYYSCSTYWSKQQEDQEPAGPSFRPLAKAALGHHHRPGQSEHHQTAPYHPWRRFSPRIPAAVCQRQPRWLMGGCVPLLAAFADVLVLLTSVFQWIGSSSPLFLLFPYSVVSWALWILSYRSASISLVTGGGWSPPECSFHSGTASFRTRLKSVTSSSRPPSRTGQEARERNVWCNWWRWWLFQQQHRLSASGSCSCDVTPLLRSTVSATHRASFSKGLHEVVALRPEAAPSSVQQPTCYRSPKRSPPLSSPSSPSTSSCCFLAVVLLVGSLSPAVVSTPAGLTAESLNPWLKADGGLILRVVTGSSSLDWVRPNPGACQPRPTVPPCPSDRYCPTRSAAEISSASGGFSNRPSSPFVFSPTGHRSPSSSSSDTMGVSVPSANTSQCLPYLHSTGRSKSSGGGGGGSVGGGGGGPSPAECICGHADGAKRIDALRKYHLHHCYHYNLWHVLSDTKREGITRSRSQCYANLEEVERLDSLAAHFVCQFEDILRRYDCAQTFSSKSSCQRCKVRGCNTLPPPKSKGALCSSPSKGYSRNLIVSVGRSIIILWIPEARVPSTPLLRDP